MEDLARPGWSLTGEDVLAELDLLHNAQTRLTARRLELLRRLDDLGHAKEIGARDTAELISLRHRLDRQVVRRDLQTAHGLNRYRTLASRLPGAGLGDDLADGAARDVDDAAGNGQDGLVVALDARRRRAIRDTVLNPSQAAVIAEILDRAPTSTRAENLAVAEAELVIAARTLLPRELRRLGTGVLNVLDTDGPAPADPLTADEADRTDPTERALAAQTLWYVPGTAVSPSGFGGPIRGLRIGGFLTGEHAELLQVLVDAGAKPRKTPSGELDLRTLGQRRADALCMILRAAAATGGGLPAHGGIKPHLSVTIPYTALTADQPTSRQSTERTRPSPDDMVPGAEGIDRNARGIDRNTAGIRHLVRSVRSGMGGICGKLVFGEPLSAADARRIACDAGIIPIVLGSQSQPLDVGREERLVTPALRRALIARDGGCVIPGCGAPPGHCDAHHLIHWADGGSTSINNLALVCPPHHRAIHRNTWHLTITNGQVQPTRPPWADPSHTITPHQPSPTTSPPRADSPNPSQANTSRPSPRPARAR